MNKAKNWVIRFYDADGEQTGVSYRDNITQEKVRSLVDDFQRNLPSSIIDYSPYFGKRDTAPISLKHKDINLYELIKDHTDDIKERMKLGTYQKPVKFPVSKPIVRATPKVGRNDPCPCNKLGPDGVVLKYKKCCGK